MPHLSHEKQDYNTPDSLEQLHPLMKRLKDDAQMLPVPCPPAEVWQRLERKRLFPRRAVAALLLILALPATVVGHHLYQQHRLLVLIQSSQHLEQQLAQHPLLAAVQSSDPAFWKLDKALNQPQSLKTQITLWEERQTMLRRYLERRSSNSPHYL